MNTMFDTSTTIASKLSLLGDFLALYGIQILAAVAIFLIGKWVAGALLEPRSVHQIRFERELRQ